MPTAHVQLLGVGRNTEMEVWDHELLDLEVPAHITFDDRRVGAFQFGAVGAGIDYRVSVVGGAVKVEFSWEGFDDDTPTCGRGWATIVADRLEGRLFFHNGDDSAVVATRGVPDARRNTARPRLRRPPRRPRR